MCRQSFYLDSPARKWEEGLPLGNGRLGAMIMGKVEEETIFLNEETLVFGPDRARENPDGYGQLGKIRTLLLEGKVEQAAFLAKMALTSTPKYNNPYQPLGDLRLCFLEGKGKTRGYARALDLEQAIATVSYEKEGCCYEREHFISQRAQVMAVRIRIYGDKMLTMSANMSRKPFEEHTGLLDERTCGNWGENGVGGMHYLTGVRIAADQTETGTMGDCVYARDQKEIVLYLAAQTDYEDCLDGTRQEGQAAYDRLYEKVCQRLDQAESAGYEALREEHVKEYGTLYGGFELQFGERRETCADMSAPNLLAGVREGDQEKTAYLAGLMVQYARYLMLSSSRNCLLPANLQGLWGGSYEPPWQCQFTININTEMNYWFVEKAGLSDCHLPLFRLIKLLEKHGRKTAEKLYGSRGFCAHHNTNVWGCSAPEGIFDASPYWVMGGAWLCLHLYEHYLYTADTKFLQEEALPLMREAIRFFEDYLYEMPDGTRVTGPVVSPENTYRSRVGETGALCMGTAMDNSILRQLLDSYLEGMKILDIRDEAEEKIIRNLREKLAPLKIGKDGRLLEWMEEYEEMEPGHRHISHLYGLHPGHEITSKQPELFEAAGKTLEYRLACGGGHTGWSRAWLACFSARLRQGEALGNHVEQFLKNCVQDNLLDVHPPFQIDGNFGIAEGILEGLVQEQDQKIILLPALPPKWSKGYLKGLCLKGGSRMSMEWEEGHVIHLELKTKTNMEYSVCFGSEEQKIVCPAKETVKISRVIGDK